MALGIAGGDGIGRRSRMLVLTTVVATALAATSLSATGWLDQHDGADRATPGQEARLAASYGRLPLSFEPNVGQFDAQVRYVARARGYSVFLSATEGRLSVENAENAQRAAVRLSLIGANAAAPSSGSELLPGRVNHLVGDPAGWRTDVPIYGRVSTAGVYPGVDLVWYGHQGELEYDFVVAPGANPNRVRLAVDGVRDLRLDDDGDLLLDTGAGQLVQRAPVVYQETAGRRTLIPSHYVLDGNEVSFSVGAYDPTRPLVIDPVLSYSTFLGGSNGGDTTSAIDVDSAGNAYLVGTAYSSDFPTTAGTLQPTKAGGERDVFVTKLNPTGTAVVYSTYLGGSENESGEAIAVDGGGNAYVTGTTISTDFPMRNPFDGTLSSPGSFSEDAFVTKLNASGSALVYSSYLGGGHSDVGRGIDVDSSGNAYVTGKTGSTGFPIASAAQPANSGGFDAFVTKVNAAGSALTYSTFLGGTGYDEGARIAVDGSGNAYLTGTTDSSNFPTLNARQPLFGGGIYDAFVTKLAASGSALAWSTYHGGNDREIGRDIALDSSGSAYVAGETHSTNFPVLNPVQAANGGDVDATVSKFGSSGSLLYSTYLGGTGSDRAYGVAVDASGHSYVAGNTWQGNFPTVNAIQPQRGGPDDNDDAFVARLNPTGSTLDYSTYLGGSGRDQAHDVAADASGNAYVTGGTGSQFHDGEFNFAFPTTPGAFQTTGAASFVTKIAPNAGPRRRPPADFDGDGDTDRSVYRNGAWFAEGHGVAFLGQAGDIPVPADYDGDGDDDHAVYRDGAWFTEGQGTAFLGQAGDIPVPADYDGDGDDERAVFRPSVGAWYIEGQATVFHGAAGDIPVPGDYDGNGTTEVGIWRPAVGGWYIVGQQTQFIGLAGDIPVPGDYDGNGTTDRGIWRPDVGGWYIDGQATQFIGLKGDVPVPGDYDGNGATDRGIWRPSVGGWYVQNQATAFLGFQGDTPLPPPAAIYRAFF